MGTGRRRGPDRPHRDRRVTGPRPMRRTRGDAATRRAENRPELTLGSLGLGHPEVTDAREQMLRGTAQVTAGRDRAELGTSRPVAPSWGMCKPRSPPLAATAEEAACYSARPERLSSQCHNGQNMAIRWPDLARTRSNGFPLRFCSSYRGFCPQDRGRGPLSTCCSGHASPRRRLGPPGESSRVLMDNEEEFQAESPDHLHRGPSSASHVRDDDPRRQPPSPGASTRLSGSRLRKILYSTIVQSISEQMRLIDPKSAPRASSNSPWPSFPVSSPTPHRRPPAPVLPPGPRADPRPRRGLPRLSPLCCCLRRQAHSG